MIQSQTLALLFLNIAHNSLFRKLKSFRVVHLHTEGAQLEIMFTEYNQ